MQGIFPEQLGVDALGFSTWEMSQKAVCRHAWWPSLGAETWKQQHLLPASTGCRDVPLQISQISLHSGP